MDGKGEQVGRNRQRAAAWARTMAVFAAIPQGVHFGGRFVRRRTALAFVLIIGTPERLGSGKSIASYLGLVPSEESSGDRRRLGHITKQGYLLLRPAGGGTQVTVRSDPEWRGKFFHLAMRRGRKIAKVAMARRLAVRLSWMWRKGWDYEQMKKFGSHAGQPGNRHGVQQNIKYLIGPPAPLHGEFEQQS